MAKAKDETNSASARFCEEVRLLVLRRWISYGDVFTDVGKVLTCATLDALKKMKLASTMTLLVTRGMFMDRPVFMCVGE